MLETKPADESDKSLVAKYVFGAKKNAKLQFRIFSCLLKVSMAAGFHVFLVFAALHDLDKAKGLLTAVGLGYLYLFYVYVGKKWAKQLSEVAIEPLAGSVFSVVGFRWKGVALVKVWVLEEDGLWPS